MIQQVLKNIFNKDAMNIILPIFLIQLVLMLGTYKLLKPNMHKKPCAVCGRATTTVKKVLWEYKPRFLKEKNIYYCKIHLKTSPRIIQSLPSKNDSILKRYWLVAAGGFLFFLSTIYSLALFEISFIYLISVPLVQLVLFFLQGMISNFSITTLFICFIAAPVLFYYIWVNIESGNIKLK